MPDSIQTHDSLVRDFTNLGIASGETILLHSSLSSLGWVCGGAPTVVRALVEVIGSEGTLVVPTQTSENSEPSEWSNPAVPESWWATIRAQMPAYDPDVTPSKGVGVIPETLRTWPGSVRSAHPQTSFAALGARAVELMADHPLDSLLGERSPLGRLASTDARVLLLGTGFDSCTAFHLAEYRVPHPPTTNYSCAVRDAHHTRQWVSFTDVATDADDFAQLGKAFEGHGTVVAGHVGDAVARVFGLAQAVGFATTWLTAHRSLSVRWAVSAARVNPKMY